MTIILILEKKEKILNLCQDVFREYVIRIRWLLKLIRNLGVAFPAVTMGQFHYRALKKDKAKILQQFNGNCDTSVRLSNEAKKELCWLITNIKSSLQSYVNNKEGNKSEICNETVKELWVWCTTQNI